MEKADLLSGQTSYSKNIAEISQSIWSDWFTAIFISNYEDVSENSIQMVARMHSVKRENRRADEIQRAGCLKRILITKNSELFEIEWINESRHKGK